MQGHIEDWRPLQRDAGDDNAFLIII